MLQISLLMHKADVPPSNVPPTVGQAGERIKIGVAGQDSNDESSESGDTTGGDTTADEDGWDSGECRTPVKKNHSNTHKSSHNTHSNAQHVDILEEAAKESHPRGYRDKNQNPNSTGAIKRSFKHSNSTSYV